MQTAPAEEVQKEVAELLSRQDIQDLQLGKLASILVCRSQADPHFYAHSSFVHLVHSQFLCHRSVKTISPSNEKLLFQTIHFGHQSGRFKDQVDST